ncbi:MAG: PHP domain-containing protein [Tepidiforma sp.]
MAAYAELHAHSCWSLREGASTTDELIDRALALGYSALALTDHDNLYGAMEFAQAARQRGLKPITGCELTIRAEGTGETSHLTVLAADAEGYRNLCRLLSRGYRTYGKDAPQVEEPWLFAGGQGLMVLSGCRDSALARLAAAGDERGAKALAGRYRDVFGDRYYVELQDHDVYGDRRRNAALARAADACGVPVAATNDVHYHVRTRHRLHDVLVAIRHRLTLDTSHAVRRPNSEFLLKPPAEMGRRFAWRPDAVANTVAIAERCAFDLTRDLPYRLPDYPVPEGATLDSFLRGVCERAFRRKYPPGDPHREEARQRLERELALIARHGLAGFFLVYWDILQLVNEVAVELQGRDPRLAPDERPVARGRGSSVSSIVCYLIGLSHIDPVRNNLYLERFLNDELHSLPDIDLDFPRDIRDELLQRIYDRYGPEHAALVAAFPTYRFRSAVLDVGKALGLPGPVLAKLNRLAGPFADAKGLAEQMRKVPELRELVDAPIWRDLVELAGQISGFPRHIGQHVGGVVVSAEPISSVVPVEPARMDGRYVCQWDKDSIEDGIDDGLGERRRVEGGGEAEAQGAGSKPLEGGPAAHRGTAARMTWPAMGAATSPPWPPDSTMTATAMRGCSTGAKAMNQACEVPSPASAVPVLPATATPEMATPAAWPASTTPAIMAATSPAAPGSATRADEGRERSATRSPSRHASRAMRGAGMTPRFATAAATSAIWSGVARSSPCPKAVEARRTAVRGEPGERSCEAAVSSGKGRSRPNPRRWAAASRRCQPRSTPSFAKTALTE